MPREVSWGEGLTLGNWVSLKLSTWLPDCLQGIQEPYDSLGSQLEKHYIRAQGPQVLSLETFGVVFKLLIPLYPHQ